MDRLAHMIAFVTLAETGSFAETATRLHLSNSVVSKRIKDLEAYLGTQLLARTTRRLRLTATGHVYAGHARRFLDELAEVEDNLRDHGENPVGDIHVIAPRAFGEQRVIRPIQLHRHASRFGGWFDSHLVFVRTT